MYLEDSRLMSLGEHPLPLMMQGPILETRSEELLQRQEKSVAAQSMDVAAVARQPRAQCGRTARRAGRVVGVLVVDDVVVCAAVRGRRTEREVRRRLGCILLVDEVK